MKNSIAKHQRTFCRPFLCKSRRSHLSRGITHEPPHNLFSIDYIKRYFVMHLRQQYLKNIFSMENATQVEFIMRERALKWKMVEKLRGYWKRTEFFSRFRWRGIMMEFTWDYCQKLLTLLLKREKHEALWRCRRWQQKKSLIPSPPASNSSSGSIPLSHYYE